MALEKAASDIGTKRSLQEMMIRQGLFMSYSMVGYYTFKPIAYGIHDRGVWLVHLVESPLDKYTGKNRSPGTGLIYLWPDSCIHFMETRSVQ